MGFPRLLLFSNSTMSGAKYLEYASPVIDKFLSKSEVKQILFIPFAGVTLTWDEYSHKVQQALSNYKVESIHHAKDYKQEISKAQTICIGGGNTFHLLYHLQKFDLIQLIRDRVLNDKIPYIGWSAGSNVATPNLATTNDMPIIWPQSDEALNLVPFNINPHYNEWMPENHQGETRGDRLDECVVIRKRPIVALSEGLALLVENGKHIVIAPDLGPSASGQVKRMAKVWLHDEDGKKGSKVVDLEFNQDITSIVS